MDVREENELKIHSPDEFEAAWLHWYNTDDDREQAELGFEIARNLPALIRRARVPWPDDIVNRFSSLSSAVLWRIADEAERIIRERAEDGVFD